MAYVINGGDKPTAKFHHFVDLCCTAFNVVRRHGSLLLNLFGLVSSEIISKLNQPQIASVLWVVYFRLRHIMN
jgi:phosphatidylinositol-4-phosphate 3-kinase